MPFEWSYLTGLALLVCLTVAAVLGWLAARLLVHATRPGSRAPERPDAH